MHFITFSRQYGAGGTDVARKVAERLGYSFYDTDAIDYKASELGFLEDVREIGERPPSFFQRIFSSKPAIDLDRLNSVVYELARKGDAVFLGWGSHMLLKAFTCALHVRIIASVDRRIENLVSWGIRREAAPGLIAKGDGDRGAFVRFAFGVDWNDPSLYDIVLNMDKLSVELAVETVLGMARSSEIRACSVDAMRSIEQLALSSRVEAAIMESGLSYGHTLSVTASVPEPGKVVLAGFVEDQAAGQRAEQVVKAVPGVHSVDNQIRVIPAGRHA
jgi:cytidylate kinase